MAPTPPPSPSAQAAPISSSPKSLTATASLQLTSTTSASPLSPSAAVPTPPGSITNTAGKAASPLELYVAIRRGRVTILTVVVVAVLMLMVYTFNCGIELTRIKDTDKSQDQQTKLLDDYNSYSGNIASLFGTPVELFVSAAVQVILLRFMTRSLTQAVPNWKLNALSVAAGAVAVYLISNGFSALNVQLRPREIEAVISAADLSLSFNSSVPGLSTNATHSFPESQLNNPITNTILRSAVLPRVLNRKAVCSDKGSRTTPQGEVKFGFMQRDWQTRVLEQALPVKQLRVVVTPSNVVFQNDSTSADLPMNASLAADLYLYSMFMMVDAFKIRKSFMNETEIKARIPVVDKSLRPAANTSLAKVFGLLPPDDHATSDELTQREFFIKRSASSLRSQLKAATGMSTAQMNMSFSHVQISDNIVFDAITIDFEIEPMILADSSTKGNATRYTTVDHARSCGPVAGQCLVEKISHGYDDYQYDPPAQIQAFAQCLNTNGSQELRSLWYADMIPDEMDCRETSNTSMLVFSVGKRITADGLTLNHTTRSSEWDSNTSTIEETTNANVATNLRKFFTVTLGRLSWQWNNLSSEFGATCEDEDSPAACLGLQFPLASTPTSVAKQRLVAGAASLPVSALPPLRQSLVYNSQRLLPLAVMLEPRGSSLTATQPDYVVGDEGTGDLLLPHNIKLRNWTATSQLVNQFECDASIEDRISSTLNNHLYNEHGLQPAYTAALFFLFEDAVVRDVIPVDDKGRVTLNFQHNVRHIALWLSVPDQSVWFTLAGCILLVVGLAAAMLESLVLSKAKSDSLAKITAPHVIARVMLDEVQFPPLLLHRHIISAQASDMHRKVDQFAIDSLGLQHQQDHDRLAAVA